MSNFPTSSSAAHTWEPLTTVLIVEGSATDRAIYHRHLQTGISIRYRILEAATLEEGLEVWRSQHPDLALVNLNLPDGSGLEFLKAMGRRQDHPQAKLPVILIGSGEVGLAVQAMKLGAMDYLTQGSHLTAELLCQCVEDIRDRKLSEQATQPTETALPQLNQELEVRVEHQIVEFQHNQRFVQRILDTSPNLIYIFEWQELRNVYVNREIATVLGYSPEEIQSMGNLMVALLHPEDVPKAKAYFAQFDTAKDGDILENEFRFRH
ncbi:MAG: response regulator, partial [Leptolyngbyaceae bacterium]|nr:response regulator [Leptolyngbyaceae bacterium]